MSRSLRIALPLLLILPALAGAVEPPADLRAAASAGGIRLEWSHEDAKAVKGVNVYRSAADPGADFKRLAKVSGKRSYLDKTVRAGETYYYYLVALDAKGQPSNKSELVSATAGDAGEAPAGRPSGRRAVFFDFGAKLHNFEARTVAFSHNPATGEAAWTDNCTHSKFGPWRMFEPFRLPAGAKAGDQVTFGARPDSFICWVWNPASGKLHYAFCRDSVRFENWTKFPYALPQPPNWGPRTVVRFDNTRDLMFFLSYNPKDGSVFMSRSTGDMFTNWTPFGKLMPPPGSDLAATHFGVGAIQVEHRKKRESAHGYWMFAYDANASLFYTSHKTSDTEWNGWSHSSNLFQASPLLGED